MQSNGPIEISFRYLDTANPKNRHSVNEMDYLFNVAEFFGDVRDIPVFSRDALLSNKSSVLRTFEIDWAEIIEGKKGDILEISQGDVIACRFKKSSGAKWILAGFFISNLLYIVRVDEMEDEKNDSRKNVL